MQNCKLFIWTTKCGRATLRNIVTAGIIIRTQETRNAASRGQFLTHILLQTEFNNCFFPGLVTICTISVKLPISGGFLTGQDGICRIVFNNLLDHNLSWQQWQMWPKLQNADPEIRHELRNLRQYFFMVLFKSIFLPDFRSVRNCTISGGIFSCRRHFLQFWCIFPALFRSNEDLFLCKVFSDTFLFWKGRLIWTGQAFSWQIKRAHCCDIFRCALCIMK